MSTWLVRETAAPAEGWEGEELEEAAWPAAGQEKKKAGMTKEAETTWSPSLETYEMIGSKYSPISRVSLLLPLCSSVWK